MTQYYNISFDETDSEFMMEEKKISDFNLSRDFNKLSAQYAEHVIFEINPKIKDEYERRSSSNVNKSLKMKRNASKTRLILQDTFQENEENNYIAIDDITSYDVLERAVDNIMSNLKMSEYYIKEIHDYTQILPDIFYKPGSHELNRKVAFALKQTDERLFLSWIMLRSKADDFDYGTIKDLYQKWTKYFKVKPDGITKQSIMYWAKQYVFDDFEKIRKTTIDYFINETISNPTEFDFATVLYQLFDLISF